MLVVLAMLGCAPVSVEADVPVYVFALADIAARCGPGAGVRVCATEGSATIGNRGPGVLAVSAFDGVLLHDGGAWDARVEIGALDGEAWSLLPGQSARATMGACVVCWDGDVPEAGVYEGAAQWSARGAVVSARVVAVVE
jgi:hypothetical protein